MIDIASYVEKGMGRIRSHRQQIHMNVLENHNEYVAFGDDRGFNISWNEFDDEAQNVNVNEVMIVENSNMINILNGDGSEVDGEIDNGNDVDVISEVISGV